MAFAVLETVKVYKEKEVLVINKSDLDAFKKDGYSTEAPKAAPIKPKEPVTPATK